MSNKLSKLLEHEQDTIDAIDDAKADYIDDDWEDEFDDIHEAYEEQGRGQAESHAVQELIKREFPNIGDDELIDLMDQLADRWGLSYN